MLRQEGEQDMWGDVRQRVSMGTYEDTSAGHRLMHLAWGERFGSSVGMRGDARTIIAADCRSAAVLAAVYGPVATITRYMYRYT